MRYVLGMEPKTILKSDIPASYRTLRSANLDFVRITRAESPSTALPDILLAPAPKPGRAFVATAFLKGEEWLAADGNSEAQALSALDRDCQEFYR